MQTDFLDAHERHWRDAGQLFSSERYANADHLYGFSAECGLKRLMLVFGMKMDSVRDWPDEETDRKHIDVIWAHYETYRSGNPQGVNYGLPTPNPFKGWKASDRYANESNFTQASVQAHQTGAEHINRLIKQAQREGLIT